MKLNLEWIENNNIKYSISVLLRYFALSVLILFPYVLTGGGLGLIIHSFVPAMIYALVTFGYLISTKRFPSPKANLEEIKNYRLLTLKAMGLSLSILVMFSMIRILSRHDEGTQAIINTISGQITEVIINFTFYLAMILTPINPVPSIKENLAAKLFSRFSKVTYFFGYFTWLIILGGLVTFTIELMQPKPPKNYKWYAMDPTTDRVNILEEQYAKKFCEKMPLETRLKLFDLIQIEEIDRLKKEDLDNKEKRINKVIRSEKLPESEMTDVEARQLIISLEKFKAEKKK